VISADSRQVYRGMNIGTGKDYDDYVVNGEKVPFHLIDIVDPGYEYNIYEYQKDFLVAYNDIISRKKLPVLCGGSGMYLEAILKGYRLAEVKNDEDFKASLENKTDDELIELLRSYKVLHNITDFEDRPRLIKAILVGRCSSIAGQDDIPAARPRDLLKYEFPKIESTIVGISYPRGLVKARIAERLLYRLDHGMIEEVRALLNTGIDPVRLMKYGLEYKFVTLFILGKISRSNLFTELNIAIRQFAKRQMTWFRRMERQGINIHWIEGRLTMEEKIAEICKVL
jgi:tRNA dimethylallyltransferase